MRLSSTLAALLATVATSVAVVPQATAEVSDPEAVVTVAHRGARHVAPENTLAAVRRAAAGDVDMVEVDVRRTKDGRLVLMHDNSLRRTTDVEKVFPRRRSYDIGDFTYRQLRRLDAGSWKRARFAGERIPTLADTIRLVRQEQTGLLIELKSAHLYPGIQWDVARTLRKFRGYLGWGLRNHRLMVQSFDLEVVRRFTEVQPDVPVALLGTPAVADLPVLATWVDEISSRHKSVDANYVAAVHATGMASSVWTVDNPVNIHANLDKGVDGVVTNKPSVLDQVLQQRAVS